jgi:hypothetical protein
VWGKPVRESSYFFNSENYISAKIKPTAFTYLFPSISVLEINWKKPNTTTLDFYAQTAVPYRLYGFLEIRAQNLLLLYGGRTVCTDH